MPIRLIQFNSSTTGRRGGLAPLIIFLAILGAVAVLLLTALFGVVALVAGSVIRLFLPGGAQGAQGRRSSLPAFLGSLMKKLFIKGQPQNSGPWTSGTAEETEQQPHEQRTISLDRDEDGVWRQ